MQAESFWITTDGEPLGLHPHLLSYACAGCMSDSCAMIEPAKDGIVLFSYGKNLIPLLWLHSRRVLIPIEGARVLISCAYCEREIVTLHLSSGEGGIFCTAESYNFFSCVELKEA